MFQVWHYSVSSELVSPCPNRTLRLFGAASKSPRFTASFYDIEEYISLGQDILSSLPRSHPLRPPWISGLAVARQQRYGLLGDVRDLNTSIVQYAHTIFLPFHFSAEGAPNLLQVFYCLTGTIFVRSFKFKEPSDITHCLKYLRYLRGQSLQPFGVTDNGVTGLLVRALALQVHLEPGNGMQVVEEMSILCRELLLSDFSEEFLKVILTDLAKAIAHVMTSRDQLPQQVIDCLREANTRLPDLHEISCVLFASLSWRFRATTSNDDYEDALAALNEMIASRPRAGGPYPYVEGALGVGAILANTQLSRYGGPEYLVEAISRYRAWLRGMSHDNPERSRAIWFLERLERRRFGAFGVTSGLPEAGIGGPKFDLSSLSNVVPSIVESNGIWTPSMMGRDYTQLLGAIYSAHFITDLTDIEEAIKYCRMLLACFRSTDPIMPFLTFMLGELLSRAFKHTGIAEYLNESIAVHRDAVNMPGAQWARLRIICRLISSLFSRFLLYEDKKDIDEALQLYPIAAVDINANVPDRFAISHEWARIAQASNHPSTSIAYEFAISLMQESLAFAPTLEIQHFRLVSNRYDYEALPLDHASYLIHMGQPKLAIETLERGRGLLWSEMRGFRTSIIQLHGVDSLLAERFAAVNQELEELTASISPTVWADASKDDDQETMDPFGRLVVKQRKLFDERNDLIFQIQALPGFERFSMAPSFDTLRSVTAHGPVVIINHCKWRSDIIILHNHSSPSLIPMTSDFYSRANGMRDKLLGAQKEGLDSMEYEDALGSVLWELYDLVGRPVIKRLDALHVPEQSRVWWCPTSVFCSLPLHAMGPIRSDGRVGLYFSDLYIPSYTPTLSTLIEARKPGTQIFEEPSTLLVAQPDAEIPGALQEMLVVQANSPSVTTLVGNKATPTAVMEHLRDHRFVHISCHGELEIGKPFNASFKLHRGSRLTLLDIVRSQLPDAEFAFLAACHTAELTEESIADEGLHLTGAVQYCGFRSVVGTMWAMADIDGPDLAGSFYRTVFADRWEGVPYYERTAEALRDAVRSLRRKRNMRLERWVNFVHYGA